jgi:hypothetical protein
MAPIKGEIHWLARRRTNAAVIVTEPAWKDRRSSPDPPVTNPRLDADRAATPVAISMLRE